MPRASPPRPKIQEHALELFPLALQDWNRVTTCPISQLTARIDFVSRTCCADTTCGGHIPIQCSYNCTRVFIPFLSDCRDVIVPLLGEDIDKYDRFNNLCTNLDVHSLVMSLHEARCWYCGDGSVDENEECDAGKTVQKKSCKLVVKLTNEFSVHRRPHR